MIFLKFFDSSNGKVEDYLRMCDKRKKIKVLNFTHGKCVYISHVKSYLKVINIGIR